MRKCKTHEFHLKKQLEKVKDITNTYLVIRLMKKSIIDFITTHCTLSQGNGNGANAQPIHFLCNLEKPKITKPNPFYVP